MSIFVRRSFIWLWVLFVGEVAVMSAKAAGVLYYNQIPSLNSPALLRRVNSDGTGDQPVPINLPSALNPTISRNGRILLVTSPEGVGPASVTF
jgi:hypothetical protein